MRSGLFIIPFVALLFAAFGTMLASSFADKAFLFKSIGWGGAAALIALWGWVDRAGFKSMFGRKGAKYGASSGVVVLLGLHDVAAE